MGRCMVEKFKHYITLTADEEKLLMRLAEREETYQAGEYIVKKGDKVREIFLMADGWTYTSTNIDRKVRSIFDVKMNGDFIGLSQISFHEHLYDLVAMTDVTICPFPKEHLDDMFGKSEKLSRTFYTVLSREQAMLHQRLTSLGRRTALEKLAHFILEVAIRMSVLGYDIEKKFDFPIRQEFLADLLGLSTIHVNRSMNELKRHEYIDYDRKTLKILNQDRLLNLANFDTSFLLKPDVDWHAF